MAWLSSSSFVIKSHMNSTDVMTRLAAHFCGALSAERTKCGRYRLIATSPTTPNGLLPIPCNAFARDSTSERSRAA